ncbi:hypothetical protein [Streptomyces erythrochromogenes]|uniref:hypothetical protein n=1 Tax=Streptomyces erythrochromogenes TaxID=285574 RepID=UPI00380A13AD
MTAWGPAERLKPLLTCISASVDHTWFNFAGDVAFALTFGEALPFLWVAVAIAVLVRVNRAGPAKLQLALSAVSAFYCALICILWLAVLLQAGWWLLLVMGAAGAFVRLVTRR